MCAAIENFSDASEAFLARCIPDLHLQHLILHAYQIRAEFYSYRHFMLVITLVVNESAQHARFANAAVANYDDLEQRIEMCLRTICNYLVLILSNVRKAIRLVVLALLEILRCLHYNFE